MNEYTYKTATAGFTLLEMLFALAMFASIAIAVSWIVMSSLRSNAIIWEQLTTQNDGRAALEQFVNDVRKAEASSVGDYAIEYASSTEFIFFSNVDNDTAKERVRFWLDGTTLKKGVTNPTGTPYGYTGEEEVHTVAESVVNMQKGIPLFEYYDDTYPVTTTPITSEEGLVDIRLVRIQLELEKDPTQTPVPLHVESIATIRSLKVN